MNPCMARRGTARQGRAGRVESRQGGSYMTMHSPKVTTAVYSFTDADLELAVARHAQEVAPAWHAAIAVEVGVPDVHAQGGKRELVEEFHITKPPPVRALV